MSLGKTMFIISMLLIIILTAFEVLARIPIIPIRLFVWFIFFIIGLLLYSIYLIYKEQKEKEREDFLRKFQESRR